MTEEEWLVCEEPQTMVTSLTGQVTVRKMRLGAIAWCRHTWAGYPLPTNVWSAIDVAERSLSGLLNPEEEAKQGEVVSATLGAPGNWAVVMIPKWSWWEQFNLTDGWDKSEQRRDAANLLRDIFGNPFRPVVFNPAWRTGTAVSLAQQMYESREFSAMPILADALQDAGCDNTDILSHCREAGATHVRGCWVVDLVLGKE